MRVSLLSKSLVIGIVLAIAGCDMSPAPAEKTTKDTAGTGLPDGFTKTKKGRVKGKMTFEARKKLTGLGIE